MAYLDPVNIFGETYGLPIPRDAAPLSSARSFARRFPALSNDMVLHYQPIVRASDLTVSAVEALVRFPRADGSLRPTLPTVRRIYDSHQGFAFDRRVVASAVAENMRWLERGIDVAVHVNVSATTIESTPGDAFGDWLAESCYAAPRLTIEVTERDTFLDASRCGDFVASCRNRGIEVAIDDFGCGYSTFELLLDLTADIVKIDCNFTARIPECDRTRKIVRSLIGLAHDLEMRVVAEGVETLDQVEWLRDAGCDELQGYFVARPMSGDDYIVWHDRGH